MNCLVGLDVGESVGDAVGLDLRLAYSVGLSVGDVKLEDQLVLLCLLDYQMD